jgi:hypothetical protein
MRKNLIMLLLIAVTSSCFAQYPASFAWPAAPGEDQKMQVPCHIFASVSTVETWYRLLYGTTPDISQAHLFSPCAHADPLLTTIWEGLDFFRDYGVVDASFLPYQNNNSCVSGSITACPSGNTVSSYYHAWIYPTNPNQIDCSLPWQNCTPNSSLPDFHYKIGQWQEVNIASYTSTDDIKRAIMNYGPIALWMSDQNLHNSTNHAYSLYGWNANGEWLLTDSWPCGAGVTQTSVNLLTIFQSNSLFKAYRLVNTATRPAVYGETRSGTSWVYNNAPTTCPEASYSNAFSISGNDVITTSGTSYTVNNIALLDNPTIEWLFIPGTGSASPTSYTGSTYTVTAVTSGSGTIKAKIKRPNGLCETISKSVTISGPSIPFTYSKIQDQCIGGGVRRIKYQVTSSYQINCVWDFWQTPGDNVTTTTNGCTFTMDYRTFNTSYGLLVNITSPSFPGVTNQATAGGPVFPCGPYRVGAGSENVFDVDPKNPVHIYPNPAKKKLNIVLPADGGYSIKLINVLGQTVFTTRAGSGIVINTESYRRGLYFVQLIPIDKRSKPITNKILLE